MTADDVIARLRELVAAKEQPSCDQFWTKHAQLLLARIEVLTKIEEAARELLSLDGVLPIDFTELRAAIAARKAQEQEGTK